LLYQQITRLLLARAAQQARKVLTAFLALLLQRVAVWEIRVQADRVAAVLQPTQLRQAAVAHEQHRPFKVSTVVQVQVRLMVVLVVVVVLVLLAELVAEIQVQMAAWEFK
jgi:hypothetical protein